MCGGTSVNDVVTKLLRSVAWDRPLIVLIHPVLPLFKPPLLSLIHYLFSDNLPSSFASLKKI